MSQGCAKCVLGTVNFLIVLIGAGFFVSGVILRFVPSSVDGFVDLDTLAERVPDYAESLNMTDVDDGKIKGDEGNYSGFSTLGIVLMILGAFIFVCGFLGLVGVCCMNRCMLVSYILIVVLVVLAQIAVVIAFSTNTYVNGVRDYLKDILEKDYKGIDDYSLEGMGWNYIMLGYECCGLDDGDDFDKARKWDNERDIDVGGTIMEITLDYPVACCKTKGAFPNKIRPKNESCAIEFTRENSHYQRGCWEKLKKDVKEETILFAVVVGVFIIVQVICAILAIVILCKDDKDKGDRYA